MSTVLASRTTATSTDPLSRAIVSAVLQALSTNFPVVPAVADAVNAILVLLEVPGANRTVSDAGVQPLAMADPVHVRVYLIVVLSMPLFDSVNVFDDAALGSTFSVE